MIEVAMKFFMCSALLGSAPHAVSSGWGKSCVPLKLACTVAGCVAMAIITDT